MGFWGTLARVGGAAVGFAAGGPGGALTGYQLGGGLADAFSGGGGDNASSNASGDDQRYNQLLESTKNGQGAQDAITQYTKSAIDSAMPSFRNNLQLTREDAIRRGVSTGDLGTSYEGDLASAFQRNISNSVASHATELYDSGQNRYADLLSGRMDRTTQQQNFNRQRNAGLFSGLGAAAGAYFGGRNGGGAQGAATGSSIGGSIGKAIGGY